MRAFSPPYNIVSSFASDRHNKLSGGILKKTLGTTGQGRVHDGAKSILLRPSDSGIVLQTGEGTTRKVGAPCALLSPLTLPGPLSLPSFSD